MTGCGVEGQEGLRGEHLVTARQASPAALARCVLAEVPTQLVEYYSHKELPP